MKLTHLNLSLLVLYYLPLMTLVILAGCAPEDANLSEIGQKAPIVVDVIVAEQASLPTTEDVVYGRLTPRRKSRLNFRRNGKVNVVSFYLGDKVEAGDLMAELDQHGIAEQREQLSSSLKQLENRPNVTDRESQAGGPEKVTDLQMKIADLDAQIELGQIFAPFNCMVAKQFADEGDFVSPQLTMFEVIEDSAPVLECALNSKQASFVNDGGKVNAVIGGKSYRLVLNKLAPEQELGTRKATFVVKNLPEERWQYGSVIELNISSEIERNVYKLPLTALRQDGNGLWSVFVVESHDGVFLLQSRLIEVVDFQAESVYVEGADLADQQVVASGLHRVVSGQTVTVQPYAKSSPNGESGE